MAGMWLCWCSSTVKMGRLWYQGGSWGQGRPPVVGPAPGYLQSVSTHLPSDPHINTLERRYSNINTNINTRPGQVSRHQHQNTNSLSLFLYHEAAHLSWLKEAMLEKMWKPLESWIPSTFSDWIFNYKMSLQSQLSTSKVLGWQSSLHSGPILLLAVVLLHNPTNGKRGCQHGGSWLVSKHELSNIEVGRREMLQ